MMWNQVEMEMLTRLREELDIPQAERRGRLLRELALDEPRRPRIALYRQPQRWVCGTLSLAAQALSVLGGLLPGASPISRHRGDDSGEFT
jgi:hypothetical protein